MYWNILSSPLGPWLILRFLSFLICLSFMMTLSACAEEPSQPLRGTVSWVYDGDTLEVEPVGKVRLIGIDTPERENSQRDKYLTRQGVTPKTLRKTYQRAKEFNIEQVKGQAITLSLDETPRDRHGRLLAYVYLEDGRLLNRVLLEAGLAVVYRRFSFQMKEDFLQAEAQAKRTRRGLWAQTGERQ